MESKSIFNTVALSEINLDDQRFRVTTSGPSGPLVASIERVGLITPVALLKIGPSYTIISGFKRTMACGQLGLRHITAKIFDAGTPLEHCVHIAIIENIFLRELNLVEQGRIILLLDQLYPDQDVLCKEANRLGLPLNPKMVNKLRIVSQMNADLKIALIEGYIALPVAIQLNEVTDAATASKISKIFSEIGLGLNRQREFVDWLIGISHREQIPIPKLMHDQKLKEIIGDTDTDRRQKSLLVRRYLKTRRYPEISKAEQRYHDYMRTLRLGKGVQLIPPAHFEGQTYAFKIDFACYEELVSRYHRLENTIASSALKSLWSAIGSK